MSDTVDITDEAGAVVISIETLRSARLVRPDKPGTCSHRRVLVDEVEAWLTCRDCSTKINPTSWVMLIANEWAHVRRTYLAARNESARLNLRKWVVCRCGERIHLMSRPEDERARKESREFALEAALEHISILAPEVAGRLAGEIARKALAAGRAGGGR